MSFHSKLRNLGFRPHLEERVEKGENELSLEPWVYYTPKHLFQIRSYKQVPRVGRWAYLLWEPTESLCPSSQTSEGQAVRKQLPSPGAKAEKQHQHAGSQSKQYEHSGL